MKIIRSSFEQGPIRPPNEARSLLIRLTRNCPWNRCLFCPVYKNKKFSLRTVKEIKEDIINVREISDHIKEISWNLGKKGHVDDKVVKKVLAEYGDGYRSIALWLYYDTGACFLQDADNLVMSTSDLVDVLMFLRKKIPEITRVTTYSRSRTIVRKSLESLSKIHTAGLDRVHVGLESGYDPVLKLVKKGVSAQQHIDAGRKTVESGMELSEYVMPGLGGQEMWREHAIETARVLNQINPHFIRIRSLRVPKRVPLYEKLLEGSFHMQSDDMIAEEIKIFIETLEGINSILTSDHIMNLLEEVSGKFPEEKEKMIEAVRRYQGLTDEDRLIYRVGRRGGAYRSTDDLSDDPATYGKIRCLIADIMDEQGAQGAEQFISDMVDRYI